MTSSFFRRHHMLFMVLMALGVVGFLLFGSWQYVGPAVKQWFGEGARRPAGTIDGRTVKLVDVYGVSEDLKIAGDAAQWFYMSLARKATDEKAQRRLYVLTQGMTSSYAGQAAGEREKPLDRRMAWYAVYQEAKHLGLETPVSQVLQRLQDFRDLGLSASEFRLVVERAAGGSEARLEEALQTDMTLRAYENWLLETFSAAVDPELRRQFVVLDERVNVRLAVLKAEDCEKEVKDPAEEAVAKQYETYKKYLPGEGPDGFGYMIPDRVAIEYLAVDPKGFEAEAHPKVTDADVAKYYEAHKDPEFVAPEEGAAAKDGDKAADETKPAEADKEKARKFRPLAEVRDEIRATLVSQEARRLALEQIHGNVSEIRAMGKERPSLDIWADQAHARHIVVKGQHTAEQLAQLRGIGDAVRGKDRMPAYALALAELMRDRSKASLAVGEISDVFVDPDGNAYAFRVTACDPRHEPASLAEVADRVKADLRTQAAYALALEKAKALEAAADAKGLETAAKEAKVEVRESGLFTRYNYLEKWMSLTPPLPQAAADPAVVTACFRMPAEGTKVVGVPLPRQRCIAVAELVDHKPPREAAYEQVRPFLALRAAQEYQRIALNNALAEKAIIARHKIEVAPDLQRPEPSPDEPPSEED